MARLETHDTAPAALTRWQPYVCWLLLLSFIPYPVHADIDVSEYETRSSIRSDKERQRLQREFERERQAELAREEARLAEEARLETERLARLAARPYPVRLTEARCTLCHAATHFSTQQHVWPGWFFVVLRMKYLNQAPIADNEVSILVGHLTETYLATGWDALLEYAFVPLALSLLVLAVWVGRRGLAWRRSRR